MSTQPKFQFRLPKGTKTAVAAATTAVMFLAPTVAIANAADQSPSATPSESSEPAASLSESSSPSSSPTQSSLANPSDSDDGSRSISVAEDSDTDKKMGAELNAKVGTKKKPKPKKPKTQTKTVTKTAKAKTVTAKAKADEKKSGLPKQAEEKTSKPKPSPAAESAAPQSNTQSQNASIVEEVVVLDILENPAPVPTPMSEPQKPATSAADPKGFAQAHLAEVGFGPGEFKCLDALYERESNWNHLASNSSSGAYGIPQSLPGEKMAAAGADWRSNPHTQIRWGVSYIQERYGSPCQALAFWNANNWY